MTEKLSNKKYKIIIAVLMTAVFIFAFSLGFTIRCVTEGKMASKLDTVMNLINKESVFVTLNEEGGKLSDDEILKRMVSTVLSEDKYAKFYDKEEYETSSDNSDGKYLGFGVQFLTGSNEVYGLIGNSPAEEKGIKQGDIVLSCESEGKITEFTKEYTVSDYLKTSGNTVTFNILRGTQNLSVTVTKSNYIASYITYTSNTEKLRFVSDKRDIVTEKNLGDKDESIIQGVAVIKLDAFQGNAYKEFKKSLEYAVSKGNTKIVLDLRDNGGGDMSVLSNIAGCVINNGGKNALIVHAKYKNSTDDYYSDNHYVNGITKISVLADDGTASASECLIGAMLYYKENFDINGLIIEKNTKGVAKTYGKGIMQTIYNLPFGCGLKFTTAFIYQPDKTTCIHEKGITTVSLNEVAKGTALNRAMEIFGN